MSSEGTSKYAIDLVFVVDITGSMSPIIDEVKELVNGFSERLISTMSDEGKGLQDLWVRVIAYRDLGFEGPGAISASTFFELPEDESKLKEYVDGLTPSGGGSEPESGLEALWLAMRSPWRNQLRSRHIIVLLTDASAHPLGTYPFPNDRFQDTIVAPRDLMEMKHHWGVRPDPGVMNAQARRLILFAPETSPWNEIGERWEQTNWFVSQAGRGCMEHEWDVLLRSIAKSV